MLKIYFGAQALDELSLVKTTSGDNPILNLAQEAKIILYHILKENGTT